MKFPALRLNILVMLIFPAMVSIHSVRAASSLSLNGSSQYVTISSSPALTPTPLTFEAWVNPNAASCDTILSRGDGGDNTKSDYIFQVGYDGSTCGIMKVGFMAPTAWDSSPSTIPLSSWTHVAVTFDGTNKQFYINGVLNTTAIRPGSLFQSANSVVYIGRQGTNCNCNYFHGLLSEVRIWNTVRTGAQIAADMNYTIGSQPGLVAYYHLSEGSGTNAFDASGNGHAGVVQDSSGWTNSGPPIPAALVVTNTADSGAGSLRATLAGANPGDIIVFTNTLSGQAIHLTNGELLLSTNVTIDASGLPGGITIDAGQISRVLEVAGGNAVLNNLTFTNGAAGLGGGLLVDSNAFVTLNNCTICSNAASGFGGGLFNYGSATLNGCALYANNAFMGGGIGNSNLLALNNCTVAGNFANNFGGALFGFSSETLNNCTICSNTAASSGIFKGGGNPVLLTNTIVTGNSNPDVNGPNNGVNNLIGFFGDPRLAPLGNYGGPTQTMPPLYGSPAIDNGVDYVTNFLTTDQRGLPRLVGAQVDVGAAEYQNVNLVMSPLDFSFAGTLRYALTYAAPGSVITFDPSLSGQTIVVSSFQGLGIGANLTIDGSGATNGIVIDGNHGQFVLQISNNVSAVLNWVTLTNAQTDVQVDPGASLILSNSTVCGAAPQGVMNQGAFTAYSCVFSNNSTAVIAQPGSTTTVNNSTFPTNSFSVQNAGSSMTINNCSFSLDSFAIGNFGPTMTINNSTFASNTPPNQGVIINAGLLRLNNCTLADNGGVGSAIFDEFNWSSNATILNNCTVVGNSGGGITNAFNPSNPGFLLLTNTIVTENAGFDLGVVYDGDFNFIGGDPQLAPLGCYGGPTLTMPPIYGSEVIDAGDDSVIDFLTTDQRGFPRWSGEDVDIGAAEAQTVPGNNPLVLKNPVRISNGGGYLFSFAFTIVPSADFTVLTSTNVALSLDQWTVLGNVAQSLPGQYQFTDSAATNQQQFYEVVSP